eukprot:10155615-Lingulodinium_polyedra.AAC.1
MHGQGRQGQAHPGHCFPSSGRLSRRRHQGAYLANKRLKPLEAAHDQAIQDESGALVTNMQEAKARRLRYFANLLEGE